MIRLFVIILFFINEFIVGLIFLEIFFVELYLRFENMSLLNSSSATREAMEAMQGKV